MAKGKSTKFDIMAIATQVGAATAGGGGAGLVVDKVLPQLNPGMQGLAMLGFGAALNGAGHYFKQDLLKAAGLGAAGAGGDRMQRHWIGGGGGGSTTEGGTYGVGNSDYTVVVDDTEVQDYPMDGVDDGGGVAGADDNGGVA